MKRDRMAQNQRKKMLETIRSQVMVDLGPVENEQQLQIASAKQTKQQTSRRQAPNNSANRTNNSQRSVNLPNSGGGGAIDPYSALFVMALAGSVLVTRNKRK